MRLKLERCDGTLFAYDVQRDDEVTRGWVWAARVVVDPEGFSDAPELDNGGIDVVRGGLNRAEELALCDAYQRMRRSVREIHLEVTFDKEE